MDFVCHRQYDCSCEQIKLWISSICPSASVSFAQIGGMSSKRIRGQRRLSNFCFFNLLRRTGDIRRNLEVE